MTLHNKSEEPTFSILIPAYNVSENLKECLNHVLKQTFMDWEAVIIDDGSSDDTGKICDGFEKADSRFRVFHQENKGISAVRNRLIELSKGRYIIFLDGDDYWLEECLLQNVYDVIEKKNAEIVAWWARILDDKTKKTKNCRNYIPAVSNVMQGKDFLYCMVKDGVCCWWSWLYAFEREFWIRCGVSFKEGRICCEDTEILYQVFLQAEKVCTVEKYAYCYRVGRETSLTRQVTYGRIKDMMEVSATGIQAVLQMELSADLKDCLCGNFSCRYVGAASAVFALNGENRKEGIRMMRSYWWITNYFKDFGSFKNFVRKKAFKLFGVRICFWLNYVFQKIKGYY